MGQSKQPKEFKDLTGGLVTDTTPLNRPENSTVTEENFQINLDGSRTKRYRASFATTTSKYLRTTFGTSVGVEPANSQFIWRDAGGISGNNRPVIQIGNDVWVGTDSFSYIDADNYKFPILTSDINVTYSYANVDGKLVVATGNSNPSLVTLNSDNTVTVEEIVLKVRDTFGEYDTNSAYSSEFSDLDDLLSEGFLNERPSSMAKSHEYNLRNQGWGRKRTSYTTGRTEYDPIKLFRLDAGVYPSNADSVTPWLKTNPDAGPNSFRLRFDSVNLADNPPANRRAPYGSFVIDLINRGQSRATELLRNNELQGFSSFPGSLATDKTLGGPTCVAEFAGRVWYGGFPDDVTGSTPHTPHLSTYLAYSQSIEKLSQVGKCFQEGDPTHEEQPDLVDTDGGILRLGGIVGVLKLVSLGDALAVFAKNGVWMVSGGESGFTANNQFVYKLSDVGAKEAGSIVEVGGVVYYVSEYGIQRVARTETGQYASETISNNIGTYLRENFLYQYGKIAGVYDEHSKVVKWLFDTEIESGSDTIELVYYIRFGCFTVNRYVVGSSTANKVFMFSEQPSERQFTSAEVVTDGGVTVTDSGVNVTTGVSDSYVEPSPPLMVARVSATSSYLDFKVVSLTSSPNYGNDYNDNNYPVNCFMQTAPLTMPEGARRKSCPYVVFNFKKEFIGVDEEGGLIEPGCLVTPVWNYAELGGFSYKFGRQFQAYRNPRELRDDYFEVLSTRSKVRGRGRSLSFLIQSNDGRPLTIYGWGLDIDTNNKL